MSKKIETTTDAETLLTDIRDQQAEVDRCAGVLAELKEQAKQAREDWEESVEGLGRLIRDRQERQLLDGSGE